nr:YkgJ family cysteine cluster protein [Candidatus Sigynarchaeota archaeon]
MEDSDIDLPLDNAVFSAPGEACACDRSGDCCYNHSILLTHYDVHRILERLPQLDIRDLVVLFTSYIGYVDLDVLAGYPAIMLENEPCYLGLRFVIDEATGQRRCRFLDVSNGLCTIHDFKPMICRTYPFIIDHGKITRLEKIRCKKPYHPFDPAAIKELRATLHRAYLEFEEYKAKIGSWNETGDTDSLDAFFEELNSTKG